MSTIPKHQNTSQPRLKELRVYKGIKLTSVTSEIIINESAQHIWNVLSKYGNVASFHGAVDHSAPDRNSNDDAAMGTVRTCLVRDGKKEVTLVERITEFNQGHSYRYQVFEWKNFPIQTMFFGFSIIEKPNGEHALSLVQNYRLKPGFMTGLMKWKIRQLQRRILIGYKHYIETGEENVPIQTLLKAKGNLVRALA